MPQTSSRPYLTTRQARRLALVRGGLLKPESTGLPRRASGRGRRARWAAHQVISRYGYLQLDTVAITGARSHVLVLLSRLDGFDPALGESLLAPGEPLFEYWGHEASWLPMDLYPTFAFRRQEFRHHPWYGDVLGQHSSDADRLLRRFRDEGPLRSLDLEGQSGSGWDIKLTKKIASAFWSRGDIAIRERRNFQRTFDLAERVIPEDVRNHSHELPEALRILLLRGLHGLGWAQTGTLAATWRLRNLKAEIRVALEELESTGEIVACDLEAADRKRYPGWVRVSDLECADELDRLRPRQDRGVLLSPFDPCLWDRVRTKRIFDFNQVLEIFKPQSDRIYGYYCMPVLAGDRLIGRIDLKFDRRSRILEPLSIQYEAQRPTARERVALQSALQRYADSLQVALGK